MGGIQLRAADRDRWPGRLAMSIEPKSTAAVLSPDLRRALSAAAAGLGGFAVQIVFVAAWMAQPRDRGAMPGPTSSRKADHVGASDFSTIRQFGTSSEPDPYPDPIPIPGVFMVGWLQTSCCIGDRIFFATISGIHRLRRSWEGFREWLLSRIRRRLCRTDTAIWPRCSRSCSGISGPCSGALPNPRRASRLFGSFFSPYPAGLGDSETGRRSRRFLALRAFAVS